MKLLSFIIPAAAALLPQQNKYLEPIIPKDDTDDETIYQDASAEHSLLLRKFDDSERFLKFAAHSSHSSHKSHSSHRSHSSGTTNKHYSHTSHTSSTTSSGTSSSTTKSTSTTTSSSTKTTPTVTNIKKEVTLNGVLPKDNYTLDNYLTLNWILEGFSTSAMVYLYQDNKQIEKFIGTDSFYTVHNLEYITSYKYQIKVIDSDKSYWSNIVSIKTGEDPFKYDKKTLPVAVDELEKVAYQLINSIENTIELPENAKIFVADFTSNTQKNAIGRELALSFRKAYKNLGKYEIISVSEGLEKEMKVSSGAIDYKYATSYGEKSSADYVCYGEIVFSEPDQYKIKIKILNVLEQNILTEKEAFVPKK